MAGTMLRSMFYRNRPFPKPQLMLQLAGIIVLKVLVLMLIWYVLIRDHKIDGSTQGTAAYFLTDTAPKPQTIHQSPWK